MRLQRLILSLALFLILYSLFLTSVQAHLIGQPPFFKINGVYSNLYPVPVSSLQDFSLPQDLGASNYLVNTPINFAFDIKAMPAPEDVIRKTKFIWDFGDGTNASGLINNHTFKKPGSYFILIYADDGSTPKPQVIQSVLINVLPNSNYQLPQAIIRVNGKTSADPLIDILKFNFDGSLQFDATGSKTFDSKIASVIWDFGDQNSDTKIRTSHTYNQSLVQIFPVLRIKDSNGFISDTYLELENKKLTALNPIPASTTEFESTQSAKKLGLISSILHISYSILTAGIVLLASILMVRWWLRGRGRGKTG